MGASDGVICNEDDILSDIIDYVINRFVEPDYVNYVMPLDNVDNVDGGSG